MNLSFRNSCSNSSLQPKQANERWLEMLCQKAKNLDNHQTNLRFSRNPQRLVRNNETQAAHE